MRLLVSDDLRETAALPGVFFGHIDDGIVQSDFNFDFGRQNTAVSFVDFSSLSRYFYSGGHSKRRQADDGVAGFLNVRVLVVFVYFILAIYVFSFFHYYSPISYFAGHLYNGFSNGIWNEDIISTLLRRVGTERGV